MVCTSVKFKLDNLVDDLRNWSQDFTHPDQQIQLPISLSYSILKKFDEAFSDWE